MLNQTPIPLHNPYILYISVNCKEMRREGYELCVSPPRILTVKDEDTGKEMEPIEEVTIDVDQV
jgi:GTP-binding protein